MMKRRIALMIASLAFLATGNLQAAKPLLADVQQGNLKLKPVDQMSFGPNGILLLAESKSASIVAVQTGDVGPFQRLRRDIPYLKQRVARAMGVRLNRRTSVKTAVQIRDMVANPASGKIYLSVSRLGKNPASAILTIGADGKIGQLDLATAKYVRVKLPAGDQSKVLAITDVEYAGNRVLAAGQCREEFGNKIFSISFPLKHNSSANIFSARTYHVAHRRWETRAPIRSFIPFEDGKNRYVVGAFACTPIAKFPLSNVKSGSKIVGTSVVELGSGNMPLDMFTYKRNGKRWLVTNTYRFHYRKNLFGPSKWWGVRVSMEYMDAKETNEEATRRNTKTKAGPNGIEILDQLFGAVQISKLNDQEMVVLRVADEDERNLEIVKLP